VVFVSTLSGWKNKEGKRTVQVITLAAGRRAASERVGDLLGSSGALALGVAQRAARLLDSSSEARKSAAGDVTQVLGGGEGERASDDGGGGETHVDGVLVDLRNRV
jgi:hypothetical protein